MTPAEEVAEVRARLEHMVELAESATSGPWRFWNDGHVGEDNPNSPTAVGGLVMPTPGTQVSHLTRKDNAAFIAAASPDRLLLVAREALGVLNRHRAEGAHGDSCSACEQPPGFPPCPWPCVEVAGVLRAWQP